MLGVYAEQSYRAPAVAGMFYPNDPKAIRQTLDAWFQTGKSLRARWRAALVPHAGWIYSGRIAAQVLSGIAIPRTVIILAPKHHPGGSNWAIAPWERWLFPGGEVAANLELTRELANKIPGLEIDPRPHLAEHAIEVQLPLLAYQRPDVEIVAITIGQTDLASCQRFAKALAPAVAAEIDDVLFIISSDMNHFASDQQNRKLDRLALEQLEKLSADGLYTVCEQHHITMCGMLPAVIVLKTLQELQLLHRAELVAYDTSATVSGDYAKVVGYAGMRFN